MTLVDMDYNTIFQVIDSWEKLKRIPHYETVAGTILFQKLFEKCPSTKTLFGFPIDMNPRNNEFLRTKRFVSHASYMIQMLDRALGMLGPDVELLSQIMSHLGKKHAKFGVKEEHFPFMGEALSEMLEEMLPEDFTQEESAAWTIVYNFLSEEMCKGVNKELLVIHSWTKLKDIDNYPEVVGPILFQNFLVNCPEAKILFGFPSEMNPKSEAVVNSKRFKRYAKHFVKMLDNGITMMEKHELTENMSLLGKIHTQYRIKEEWFPLMGKALVQTLREVLKDDFCETSEEAWTDTSLKIVKAMNTSKNLPLLLNRQNSFMV